MNVVLAEGYSIKSDTLQYELHVGGTTYYYRSLEDALTRGVELIRKDKTQAFTGDVERYTAEIIKVNKEIYDEILRNLNERGVL